MDTTSMEQRLNRLFSTKTDSATVGNSDGLAFWERELIESRKQACPAVASEVNIDAEEAHVPVTKTHTSQKPPELIPGTAPDQILYLSKGRRTGGTYPSELDNEDDDYESDIEPMSSSHELVGQFCIFSHVAKFPYKYMQDPESRVSRRFFASEKIYERGWDMHYLFGTDIYSSKPLMLVPLVQVETLISDIRSEFHIDVSIPDYPFQISFYNDGMPSPTYIGRVNSKADFADVQSKISYSSDSYAKLPSNATKSQAQDHAAWEEKLERANESEKRKKGTKKQRKKRQTTFPQGSIERAQRYLGLQSKPPTVEKVRSTEPDMQQKDNTDAVPLDVNLPAPFPFEDDTLLISFDVESWEMDHTAITEIGLSVLDTADIKSIAPGPMGEEWIKKIRSRHFRIKGRESLRNVRFCEGNPDMFQFGTSEFVTIEKAPETIDRCFEHPYSAGYECAGPRQTDKHGFYPPRAPVTIDKSYESDDSTSRTLLLVGHGIDGDIAYLSSLGSNIFGTKSVFSPGGSPSRRQRVLSSIREQFDTAILYQTVNKDTQPTSLTKMCNNLGITAWYAHNAGNDARYTLEAFVKLVIRSRLEGEGKDVGPSEQEKTTAKLGQYSPIGVKADIAQESKAVDEATAVNWSAPVPDPDREWKPVSDRAYQSGRGVVESDDEEDEGDVDGSSDELPY